MSNRITCSLKTGRSDAIEPSERNPANVKQIHWHPNGRKIPWNYQQVVFHMLNRMTYILRANRSHKTFSKIFACQTGVTYNLRTDEDHKIVSKGSYNMQNETTYMLEQTNPTKSSAKSLTHVKETHLPPEGRQMPQDNQQRFCICQTDSFTYYLKVGRCHKAISKRFWTCQTESFTI
jgi:hypothetical protein